MPRARASDRAVCWPEGNSVVRYMREAVRCPDAPEGRRLALGCGGRTPRAPELAEFAAPQIHCGARGAERSGANARALAIEAR